MILLYIILLTFISMFNLQNKPSNFDYKKLSTLTITSDIALTENYAIISKSTGIVMIGKPLTEQEARFIVDWLNSVGLSGGSK